MTLSLQDFAAFHREVHDNNDPFPWQERLLRDVIECGWPKLLDIPTGAGKTTCIDIALFSMALEAGKAKRCQPRRIAMVVDRRIVVDQVAERGRQILRALLDREKPVSQKVAGALRSLCDAGTDEDPVGVYTLRGGMPKDDGWARDPSRPLILASTVDQIGSRLLIQGYGVSVGMRPVHAGLVGNDTLLLLDEVHLSQPFAETLQQISELRKRKIPVTSPFVAAFLSATPGLDVPGKAFLLGAAEMAPETRIGKRLHVNKPAVVRDVENRTELEGKAVDFARDFLKAHRVIAVVVNRVATARCVARNLREAVGQAADVVLLTGRMRPVDRDDVLRDLRPRVQTGWRDKAGDATPLVVVATQCIEAGADFDFDALVTECASLDALRQRFGRVDRLGDYKKAEGAILFDKSGAKDDPVYGESAAATCSWLKERSRKRKSVDFGVAHFTLPDKEVLRTLVAPKPNAPVLLPAYLDLWMQTSPRPAVVPEVSLWLHGPNTGPADVQVVWRADMSEKLLEVGSLDTAIEVVGAIRPSSLEALSVPFAQAKRWLSGEDDLDVPDVEGSKVDEERDFDQGQGRRALRWRGDESEIISARELRPGDTIVVPSKRGGIADQTFDAAATVTVLDVAERAALLARGLPMLRLHPDVLAALPVPAMSKLHELEDAERRLWLRDAAEAESTTWIRLWLSGLARAKRPFSVVVGDEEWSVLRGNRLSKAGLRRLREASFDSCEDGVDLTTDEDDSYHAGRAVSLELHSGDVEGFARRYADRVGLPESFVRDVALAGYLHDVGKADRRFQLLLRGGDEIELVKHSEVLAKSGMAPEAKREHRLAAKRSGYPRGARHEVMSLAMIDAAAGDVAQLASDFDLVRHLVASHHGYCRPFAPAVPDGKPVDVGLQHRSGGSKFQAIEFPTLSSDHGLHRLDSPLAERFWALVEKYGWWELCWLEAIVRLADHRASEAEQEES